MNTLLTLITLFLIIPTFTLSGFYALTVLVEQIESRKADADAEALRLAVLSGAVRSTRPAVRPMPAHLSSTVRPHAFA